MWVIRSESELEDFERRNGLVSIYVDHGYDPKFNRLVAEMERAFNENVGPAWHLLIPVINGEVPDGGYVPNGRINTEDYNIGLARIIAEQHDLKQASLPALIFEFVPKREYYSLSLAGMDIERVRKIIAAIGEIAREEFRDGNRDLTEFRTAAHRRIVKYLWGERAFHFVMKTSPTLAAMIGTIAGVKGITG